MLKLYAGLAVAAIVAAVGGTLAYTMLNRPDDQFAQCRATAIAGGAGDIGGPFTLVNSDGATVTDADIITGPTLVYFGYTFCPDVCPFDMARNALAVDVLEEMGIEVTPVFISIDPERDTPDVLANYLGAFSGRIRGYGSGYGHSGMGLVGVILIVLLILLLLGKI